MKTKTTTGGFETKIPLRNFSSLHSENLIADKQKPYEVSQIGKIHN